jgi:tetratricopeptide (TPR) repeat protein/O-antigen ligase
LTTRLGYYADRVIEMGWLAAALIAPLFFNVYSTRVFEPDKIAAIRSLVLIMLVAWIIKLFETGRRAASASTATTRAGKAGAASQAVVETVAPSWLGFLRVPMVAAILVYALAYLISSIFSVTPEATIWGSYQRLQGTYSQYSYMMLGILVLANMRTRPQFERLINFMLLTSLPVALYGLLQAVRLDPLPWAGDTATRVASSMGNAIFVAAWLIMVVPFTLYRLFLGASGVIAARNEAQAPAQPTEQDRRGRQVRRTRVQDLPGYGWAAAANGTGVIIAGLMVLFMALKMMAGMPFPDAKLWWLFPLALAIFYGAIWAVEWTGNRRDDPIQRSLILPIVGVAVFLTAFLAMAFSWSLAPNSLNIQIGFEGTGFLWALFTFLLWASIAAAVYALSNTERADGLESADRGIIRASLNVGYGLLLVVQLACIYLTQSRGPWLGLGMGLVAFAVAMWLIGRRRGVRWMARIGGVASAIVLVGALFVAALNIPDSPLKGLSNLPVVGRGIERLSTLTRTEDGTGKVRRLIWEGATNLILDDPARTIIGWGPEAMYVAYNRFYPAELAQVELRNATPDRSHNVEFDQLVTMGVVGLLAYYFLVGSFFYYAIRLLKRAAGTRDQLIAITLIAAMAAHFVEIQTGIQIASTWTYFYLIVGMMVAFGYYITTYLRQSEAAPEVAVPSPNGATPETEAAGDTAEPIAAGARPVAVATGARSTVTAQVSGNGKAAASQTPPKRGRTSGQTQQARSSGQGGKGGPPPRRPSQPQYGAARGVSSAWVRNPLMLVVYGVVLLVALLGVFRVNAATVQADTLFKQAQAYDNVQRYFRQIDRSTNTVYPGSMGFYEDALSLQPNQDYYYLFLGRAWLEAAKQAMTEPNGNARTGVGYPTDPAKEQEVQAQRKAEELFRLQESERILKQANTLSPINTDHYANLGRLYLHWSNPAGGNDPSKAPLAVQYMHEAVTRTPGNAQLWYEYGVALARNGQYREAMDALVHSQRDVDPTFVDTPFVRGQLTQERAANIRAALVNGQPLPTDGETDFGKLTLEVGQAYSETIRLDVKRFADTNPGSKLDFLASAATPFTNTNSTVPQQQLANVLTDTVGVALANEVDRQEREMVNRLRDLGAQVGEGGEPVPADVLQQLWAGADYASGSDAARNWTDPNLQLFAQRGSSAHYLRALVYDITGDAARAREELERAVTLLPSNALATEALQSLGQ